MKENLLNKVAKYYTQKIEAHGATPQGVDWNGEESQTIRFKELTRVISEIPEDARFTLLDYGCGYGGMLDYLMPLFGERMHYTGYDISAEMIAAAKQKYGHQGKFIDHLPEDVKYDFIVASGIFNVKQDVNDNEWLEFIHSELDVIHSKSTKGFAFNILTSYSDENYKRDYLYYASPEDFFGYCKTHFARNISLLHDYQLYEFTIIVKK
jgi:SAM-dependent methyltransferase